MDKYLVRTPRRGDQSTMKSKKTKVYNQLSIHDLKGVVVIEDVMRINGLLRVVDQDPAILQQSLIQLSKKIPSRDVLKSSKIGHAVKRLVKHSDESVSSLAKKIVNDWKTHFEAKLTLPTLDVQCDRKTESVRQAARKHLKAALAADMPNAEETISDLSEAIEVQVFFEHRRIINGNYQRFLRRIVLALQSREPLRQSLLEGKLTVSQLVSDFKI